ncbi:MAG: 5-oxoprolinase subunit PxpA [Flavobacteriaceae bacterium]
MKPTYIDINCDAGEGIENEEALFPHISSCNIACGGHAGDRMSMEQTVQWAQRYRVRIGAHPSYPDKVNFGRKSLSMDPNELTAALTGQINGLENIIKNRGAVLHHIKPHGALYNDLAKDGKLVATVLNALLPYRKSTYIYAAYGSLFGMKAINSGFKVKWEAFLDRNYNDDLTLVSRTHENALIQQPEKVFQHMLAMYHRKKVKTVTGMEIDMLADTYCVHGDTPAALPIMTYMEKELKRNNITIAKA